MTNICPITHVLILSLGEDLCEVETVYYEYTQKIIIQVQTCQYKFFGEGKMKGKVSPPQMRAC